ncbi:hypothetical protein TRICHSKD4_3357 [Roseibium sp. TrichSKD4]|uniref:head-tail joining protein n=1 Tax=Roseibium sp. TrichSKD4 TaxID=744980 RepID=UPI0001E56F51|nr:hypothetical protein [Roseibium sp. TrichSKD4]EFO31340.1 hypothetical protein TRICHSKD4_3357 [Roseibium sp. TrichSKD4]
MTAFDRLSRRVVAAAMRLRGEPVTVRHVSGEWTQTVTGIFTELHETLNQGEVETAIFRPVVEISKGVLPTEPDVGDTFLIRGREYKAMGELPATDTSVKLTLHRTG